MLAWIRKCEIRTAALNAKFTETEALVKQHDDILARLLQSKNQIMESIGLFIQKAKLTEDHNIIVQAEEFVESVYDFLSGLLP